MEVAMMSAAALISKLIVPPGAKKAKSIWKNEKEIEKLGDTIDLIRDVLYDVEGKRFQEISVNKGYKRLRNAFLDAEDFLDRVDTLKKKKDLQDRMIKEAKEEIDTKANGKVKRSVGLVGIKLKPYKKKVLRFFSKSNQAKYALEVNNTITKVRKNLDAIAEDMQKFGPNVPSSSLAATQMTARASGPYVNPTNIIGRDEDKKKIVDLLLRSSVDQKNIPVISIVATGGMGKTTAAQLVYNDKSWQESCQFEGRLWVSDSKKLVLKSLLKHILKSIRPVETGLDDLEDDHLKERIVEKIRGKRFLLVLDDVENEDQFSWDNLKGLLDYGTKESRILVTTRSRKVAKVVGSSKSTHELRGLSEEDSSKLFESCAFQGTRDESLVEIGNRIVEKCCGVPLAIKVVGSLLRDEGKHKWEYFRDNSLTEKTDEGNQIMDILKLSYIDLDPTLKQCFSFCALFPKNWPISRETLSNIWMANVRFKTGNGETVEDACDKSLRILYNRCFLEAEMKKRDHDDTHLVMHDEWDDTHLVMQDEWDDVAYFKLHDLMHDLVKEVAGAEILVVDWGKLLIEEDVRHIMLNYGKSTFEPKGRRVRSLICYYYKLLNFDELVDCRVLRFLHVHKGGVENITDSIGKLIHLRYLCLSYNYFQSLPHSIAELINLRKLELASCGELNHLPSGMGALTSLEVLDLSECEKLQELPSGIEKLVRLKRLLLPSCRGLTHLPSGMGALTSLEVLDISVCSALKELPGSMEKLMKLKKLLLRFCERLTHLPSGMGGLTSLEVLDISFCWELKELPRGIEKLMKLKKLLLAGCTQLTHLPSGMGALTSLEVLDMYGCSALKELPRGIEKLMKLKKLLLGGCTQLTHLPSGMGALTSLEVLDIRFCWEWKELPRGIEKLMKLKKLLFNGCSGLARMPSGMGALLGVCEPPKFIVGDPESNHTAQLEELGPLSDLPKELVIELPGNSIALKEGGDGSEAFLLNKRSLRKLEIRWQRQCNPEDEEEVRRSQMEVLGKLQPPTSLEEFGLRGYQVMEFPGWMPKDGFAYALPNLVSLSIRHCRGCRYLPRLCRLDSLRYLCLLGLSSLEYIIEEENDSDEPFCLPQLESLELNDLPALKGWRGGVATNQSLVLPSLSRIELGDSPNLVPNLLSVLEAFDSSSSSVNLFAEVCKNSGEFVLSKGKEDSLALEIREYEVPERASSYMVEAFRGMSHGLTSLTLWKCEGLKTLPGLHHLNALRELYIKYCDDFTWEEEKEEEEEEEKRVEEEVGDEMDTTRDDSTTTCLHPSRPHSSADQLSLKRLTTLQELTLFGLPNLVTLPEGLQYVTSLQWINVTDCGNLQVPDWAHGTYHVNRYSKDDYYLQKKKNLMMAAPPVHLSKYS